MEGHLAPGELLDFSLKLVGPERRDQLETHLADCALCQRFALAELREGETPSGAEVPMQLGRFTVRRVIGAGAMGLVFEAHDPQLDRPVAIKLRRGAESPGEEQRLLDEARAMARLASPYIVAIYEVGREADVDFLVIEFVEGTTLRQQLELPGQRREAQLALVVQAGRGLAAAHRAGVVHRDVKPENVLVETSGRARVTDFGLAAFKPRTGVCGTPAYMAPEVKRGAPATAASDQYSFCVTAFEALTGRRPEGDRPAWPAGARIASHVRAAISRGLSPDPAARFPSMEPLLAQLEPRSRLTPRRAWALSTVTMAALGLLGWTLEARSHDCQGADAIVGAVWNDAVKARAEAAFLATQAPYAKDSWALTRATLDAWGARWVQARTDACTATRVRGEQTERQQLLRFACLQRRLTELSTLVGTFGQADATLVAKAGSATESLSPLADCANVKQLEDLRAPPPELATEARALAEQLSRGRALLGAGLVEAARRELEPAAARTTELKLSALEADAREALGELLNFELRFEESREQLDRALQAAVTAGDDVTAARVLSRLVSLVGWRLARADEARMLARLAGALVRRIGGDQLIEARLEEGLGDTAWQADDAEGSLSAFRRSLALFSEASGRRTLDAVRVRTSIGWALADQGELEQAREELEAARQLHEQLLGPEHPALLSTWNALSMVSTEQRDNLQAIAWAQRGIQLAVPSRQVPLLATLAVLLVRVGRASEALPLADALLAQELGGPMVKGIARRARIDALTALGRADEAWAEGQAALRMLDSAQHRSLLQGPRPGRVRARPLERRRERGGVLSRTPEAKRGRLSDGR